MLSLGGEITAQANLFSKECKKNAKRFVSNEKRRTFALANENDGGIAQLVRAHDS